MVIVEGICAFFPWNWAISHKSTKFGQSVEMRPTKNFRPRPTSNLLCDGRGGHFVSAIIKKLFSGNKYPCNVSNLIFYAYILMLSESRNPLVKSKLISDNILVADL